MADPTEAIRAEALRIEQEAGVSARAHEAAAKPWAHLHLWLGIPVALLAAAAGVSTFSDHATVAGILEIVVAVGTALVTFMNPSERHVRHREAAHGYQALQNDARVFREVECAVETDAAELAEELEELNERRNDLNEDSPLLPPPGR